MLSPVNYEAPTPPPQPSPGAFSPRSLGPYNKYSAISPQHVNLSHTSPRYDGVSPHRSHVSPHYDGMSPQPYHSTSRLDNLGSGSPHSPRRVMDNGHAPHMNGDYHQSYSQRSRQSPNIGRKHVSPDSSIIRNGGPGYSPGSQHTNYIDSQYDVNRNKSLGPADEDLALSR